MNFLQARNGGLAKNSEAIVGPTWLNTEEPKQKAVEKIKFFCNHLGFANTCLAFCICLSTTGFAGIKLTFKLNPREFINPLLWIRQLVTGNQHSCTSGDPQVRTRTRYGCQLRKTRVPTAWKGEVGVWKLHLTVVHSYKTGLMHWYCALNEGATSKCRSLHITWL